MADNSRLITVAIHTFNKATALKNLLQREGVPVVLQNVNLQNPAVSPGVRVRIHESDLPLALRIIENTDIFTPRHPDDKTNTSNPPLIIVPVDFSPCSHKAVDVAFHIAHRFSATIILLHSFIQPLDNPPALPLSDALTFEAADTQLRQSLQQEATLAMQQLIDRLRIRIKHGQLPPVKCTPLITEGIPEEVIIATAKEQKPLLIVMGTRGADRKRRDLVGSVTAEVLDSCRFPVLTIPDESKLDPGSPLQAVYFSNLDQEDILALDTLYRLFPIPKAQVTLVNVPSRRQPADMTTPMKALLQYCTANYPAYTFSNESIPLNDIISDFPRLAANHNPCLIVIPNKKRNVFARLFNPGIPHRLLFHSDIAMLSIPV